MSNLSPVNLHTIVRPTNAQALRDELKGILAQSLGVGA